MHGSTGKILALALLLSMPFASLPASAQTPAKAGKAAAKTLKVSTLDGRFAFNLPDGYVTEAMPAGAAQSGTAGARGTMYMNEKQRRVVIATEMPTPEGVDVDGNDPTFLDGAAAGFTAQQSASLADYTTQDKQSHVIRTLGVRQIDSTATRGGGKTLTTTFVAAAGGRLSVVEVISRADDPKGHAAMVKQIVGQ